MLDTRAALQAADVVGATVGDGKPDSGGTGGSVKSSDEVGDDEDDD